MVHQYKLDGYNIVLDTCSGSVHLVDEVAYDIIALYPDHTPDEICQRILADYPDRPDVTEEEVRACIDDVTALKEEHKLFTPDTYAPMPPRGPHLQPELLLLLRQPGQIPGRAGPHVL